MPEYLWRVAEYIGQAGKWQGTATELLSAAGVDGFPKEYHLHTLRHYYRQRAMNAGWQETGYLILKVDSLSAGKKAVFTSEEIRLARSAVNQLRNKKIQQGQYTDATDDMLLKLADVPTFRRM